jgi:hypothetical protein
MLADAGGLGPAPFAAMGLFLAGVGAAYWAWWLNAHRRGAGTRGPAIGLGVLAGACLLVATIFPVLLGARPALGRPSTTARLEIVSPTDGEVLRGDPASISVALRLRDASIVPFTSLRLVPNEGHVHLYLDGRLVYMSTGLQTTLTAEPGDHELRAEFVAVDHGPFDPRVVATATFSISG